MSTSFEERVTTTTDPEAVWLAALIDGEGTIGLNAIRRSRRGGRDGFQVFLAIANTHRGLLDQVLRIAGVGGIYSNSTRGTNTFRGNRECFRWQTVSRRAAGVLQRVHPYLVIKQEQATTALAFQATIERSGQPFSQDRYAYQETLWLRCKNLNQGAQ